MNKQQELIEAVRKGESVRIIRGQVNSMKVLEWIEKNLPEVRWHNSKRAPTAKDVIGEDNRILDSKVFMIEKGNELSWERLSYRQEYPAFQAYDLLDYDRQGPIIERHGKKWQEVVPGQIISGQVECLAWNIYGEYYLRRAEFSCVIPETKSGQRWFAHDTLHAWKHIALPVTQPPKKKITMAELMELVGDVLKEKIGGEFEIVGDGV